MKGYSKRCVFLLFLLQTLHRGTTVLHLDVETHQVASVFLKLERCSGTLTWCRPLWKDPRKGFGLFDQSQTFGLDTVETAVSPGLRLKYTNRSGESLAYQVFSNICTRMFMMRFSKYIHSVCVSPAMI